MSKLLRCYSQALLKATLGLTLGSQVAGAAETVTQVTTYVVKTQEERQNTRFTLTEWLRIKERMKMMDVWLAMFSDPQKDKFQPELLVSGFMTSGKVNYAAADGQSEVGEITGRTYMGQLWLTNIVSSTIGIRSLNIDFGIEGFSRQATKFSSTTFTNADGSIGVTPTGNRSLELTAYGADLRLFGRNIQDSALVLKGGRYTATNTIIDPVNLAALSTKLTGTMVGVDLQLYLLRVLGAEGGYMTFGPSGMREGPEGSGITRGVYYHYEGFVEVSILRLMAGTYVESWDLVRKGQVVKSDEKGLIAGVKLQF